MSIRGWITAQHKVAVIHVQLSFLQWQNNSQLGYPCTIWFHQGLWHTRCDLSGEWLWLEHYWHYFITKCTWVLRLFAFHCQISPFHRTPPPPLFFSVPVLSVKCYDNITHSIRQSGIKVKFFLRWTQREGGNQSTTQSSFWIYTKKYISSSFIFPTPKQWKSQMLHFMYFHYNQFYR